MGAKRCALWATTWLMFAALCQGETGEFERLRRENTAQSRAFGDRGSLGTMRWAEGDSHLLHGRYAEADLAYEAALAIYRELGADIVFARVTSWQSFTSIWAGAYERARAQAQRALEIGRMRNATRHGFCGHAHMALGRAALAEGAWADAEQSLGESLVIYGKGHPDDWQAQALSCLSLVARAMGQGAEARQHLAQALQITLRTRGMVATAVALSACALLLCDAGEAERAVEVYAVATRHPFAAGSPWFEDVAGRTLAGAAEGLPKEVVAAAKERGCTRDVNAALRELLTEITAGNRPGG